MVMRHTEGFIEQALSKVYSRGDRTIKSVADELNINCHTVKNWMKRKSAQVSHTDKQPVKDKRPKDWSRAEQWVALQETHGLEGEALNAWCREKGIFAHHLTSWKAAFCKEEKRGTGTPELRELKHENEQLKRELVRKEKALAEAAALLVLQKKFRALWEGEVK